MEVKINQREAKYQMLASELNKYSKLADIEYQSRIKVRNYANLVCKCAVCNIALPDTDNLFCSRCESNYKLLIRDLNDNGDDLQLLKVGN